MESKALKSCLELDLAINLNSDVAVQSNISRETMTLLRPPCMPEPLVRAAGSSSPTIYRSIFEAMMHFEHVNLNTSVERAAVVSVLCNDIKMLRAVCNLAYNANIDVNWNEAIYSAISEEHTEALEILLQQGLTHTQETPYYFSYMFACRLHKTTKCMEVLKKRGLVDDPFSCLLTQQEKLVKHIVNTEKDEARFQWRGCISDRLLVTPRPIHYALTHRLTTILPTLNALGGPANAPDDAGISAECARYLWCQDYSKKIKDLGGILDLLKGNFESGSDREKSAALCLASATNRRAVVEGLLATGVDPNVKFHESMPYSPLRFSLGKAHSAITSALLSSGASLEDVQPEHSAILPAFGGKATKELPKILHNRTLKHGTYYLNALCSRAGVVDNDEFAISTLIDIGVDVNSQDESVWKFRPLHHIATGLGVRNREVNCCKLILDAGAERSHVDDVYKATPADWLRVRCYPDTPSLSMLRMLQVK